MQQLGNDSLDLEESELRRLKSDLELLEFQTKYVGKPSPNPIVKRLCRMIAFTLQTAQVLADQALATHLGQTFSEFLEQEKLKKEAEEMEAKADQNITQQEVKE